MKTEDGQLGVVPVLLSTIEKLSRVQVHLLHNLRDKKNFARIETLFGEVMRRLEWNPPLLSPLEDMEIEDIELRECAAKRDKLVNKLRDETPRIEEHEIEAYERK